LNYTTRYTNGCLTGGSELLVLRHLVAQKFLTSRCHRQAGAVRIGPCRRSRVSGSRSTALAAADAVAALDLAPRPRVHLPLRFPFAPFQIAGLNGPKGILPAGEYLEAVQRAYGARAIWFSPTLFWLGSSSGSRAAAAAF